MLSQAVRYGADGTHRHCDESSEEEQVCDKLFELVVEN